MCSFGGGLGHLALLLPYDKLDERIEATSLEGMASYLFPRKKRNYMLEDEVVV